ncbi:MAG: PQQ-binding-like beta-propeller repeat protein [Planctomycetes bacterium]|nr:PQQ-binding-like beta-propeller repeat protein [Planctomycetota bacterium]
MSAVRRSIAVLVLVWAAPPLPAQDVSGKVIVAGENDQILPRLVAADRLVAWGNTPEVAARMLGLFTVPAGVDRMLGPCIGLALENNSSEKWERALEEYQRLLLEESNALIPLPKSNGRYGFQLASTQLRRLCHQRLAQLPPLLREQYRRRVDAEANKLFLEGKEQRAPAPLRRLVNEHFCSRYADQALDLLGDLAFETGNFEEALHWWRHLVLGPGEMPTEDVLLFPDPRVDVALIQAKQVLALAFMGRHREARTYLARWQHEFPKAEGRLGGERGLLAPIAARWIDKVAARTPSSSAANWPTFGGSSSRSQPALPFPSSQSWLDGPTWRARLPDADALRTPRGNPVLDDLTRRVAFHPIINGEQVLIADSRSIAAYHLFTGKIAFRFHLHDAGLREPVAGNSAEGRFTLSAWDKLIFASLGRQTIGTVREEDKDQEAASYLVCLDAAAKTNESRLRWHVRARTPNGKPAVFEGAPVAEAGKVFVAVSRVDGGRTHTAVACFDAHTGRQRWWREICDAAEFDTTATARVRPHLLTMTAAELIYSNHAGAIIALDPWNGQCLWAVRYPSRGSLTADGSRSPRDLAPCVFAGGRLYAAPRDSDRVFCLEPTSGRLIWQREGPEVVHVIGVARDRLVLATSHGKQRGMQALDAATGDDLWLQPAVGTLPSLGKGLILGNWMLWPTTDSQLPYRAIHLLSGTPERPGSEKGDDPIYFDPTSLRNLIPGNMSFGNDCLVIAGLEELVVYVPSAYDPSTTGAKDQKETRSGNPWKLKVFPIEAIAARKNDSASIAPTSLALPVERSDVLLPARLLRWASSKATLSATVLVQQASGLACIALGDKPLSWQQKSVVRSPTWADRFNDLVLVGGPGGVEAHRILDGALAWRFEDSSGRDCFSAFQLNERLLFFLQEQRNLIALDPATGLPAWHFVAPGGEIRPLEGGLFHPHFHAGNRFVILQTNSGRLFVLDSRTGMTVCETTTAKDPWPSPPAALDEDRIALADPEGRVRLIQPSTGRTIWLFEPPAPTSLTGELPQILLREKGLFALIPRNIGPDLVRLDPATGRSLWSVGLAGSHDLCTASFDGEAIYFVSANRLLARSLTTGKQIWERALPGNCGTWHTHRTDSILVIHPSNALRWPWLPFGGSGLSWAMALTKDRMPPQEQAICLVDPKDGRLVQRLVLTHGRGPINLQILPHSLVAGCDDKTWIYRSSAKD